MTNKQKYNAEYYAAHCVEISKRQAKYRAAHRKKRAEQCAAWRVEHVKEIAKYNKAHRKERASYQAEHRKDHRKANAKYASAHRKEIAEHRAAHSAEAIWRAMHHRAGNHSGRDPAYTDVKVCRRWSGPKGQANFLADMGTRPAGTSLSRFADTGNYKPSNCAWHTPEQQCEEARKKRLSRRRTK